MAGRSVSSLGSRGLFRKLVFRLLVPGGLLLATGCDLVLEPLPQPKLAVVSSTGEVRLLSGDDELVEVAWTGDVLPSSAVSLKVVAGDVLVGSGPSLSHFSLSGGVSRWPRLALPSDVLGLATSGTDRLFSIGFNELVGMDIWSGTPLWDQSLLDELLGVSDSAIAGTWGGLAVGGLPVRLLDTESGIVRAEATEGSSLSSVVLSSGALLFVGDDEGVRALDGIDLSFVWESDGVGPVDRLALGSAGLLVSSLGEGLHLVDAATGELLASAEAGEVFREVAASDDLFFAARSDGTLLALDSGLGEVWRFEASPDFGGLSSASGNVYYAHGSGVEALTTVAGDLLWARDFAGSVVGLEAL